MIAVIRPVSISKKLMYHLTQPNWRMALRRPLIAICGTTGVGKSNLAVELALQLQQGGSANDWSGAKIINADSMQVYEGLDIITNKMPLEERKGVEHLLMDIKKPGEQYVVGQWVQDAITLVNFSFHSLMFPFEWLIFSFSLSLSLSNAKD